MKMNLHISNLCLTTTDQDLMDLLTARGTVLRLRLIALPEKVGTALDGWVEMSSFDEGHAAIAALNGSEFRNRRLQVGWATPQQDRAMDRAPSPAAVEVSR